jgi:hypothetical protein
MAKNPDYTHHAGAGLYKVLFVSMSEIACFRQLRILVQTGRGEPHAQSAPREL